MADVYVAPKPPPEPYRHECDYPSAHGDPRPVGSIWKCWCGRYWFKYTMRGLHWTGAPSGCNWQRVRWWNWRKNRRIRLSQPGCKSYFHFHQCGA